MATGTEAANRINLAVECLLDRAHILIGELAAQFDELLCFRCIFGDFQQSLPAIEIGVGHDFGVKVVRLK